MRISRFLVLTVAMSCHSGSPVDLQPVEGKPIRLRSCEGPATSLPANLAATLAPRLDYHPDHKWADFAERVPGGFGGVLYRDGRPVLRLTDPSRQAEAKDALEPLIPGFPVRDAVVEPSRWDFAQLVNWYDYLSQHSSIWTLGLTSGDKSEGDNRIVFGVADSASLGAVRDLLVSVPIPCDLVLLEIRPPAELR